jgi:hypothetical protein
VSSDALFCPKCGVRLATQAAVAADRSREVALALAIIPLSFVTWLYTYRQDSLKFWIGLAASVAATTAWVVGYYTTGSRDWFVIWLFTGLGLWLWALVSQSSKGFSSWSDSGRA